jgi:N6-adenosine-specific RNA methylase IME4/ParB-like chromosome segregation protein Spo0J
MPRRTQPEAIEFHPLADVLPLLEGAEFDRLVEDIREQGLLNPITIYQGKILDGRNRYRACLAAGVKPRYVDFTGDDPAAFVLSQNLARRHLGPSERAMVAARMANLKWGQRADRVEGPIGLSSAAELVGVSERSVKRARVVIEHGTPDLQQAVERGRIAVHEAAQAARQSPEAQADYLATVAADPRTVFRAWRDHRGREERAAALAHSTSALPVGGRRWALILADPPWNFRHCAPGRANTHPSRHYEVMEIEEICALPVGELAAEHCVLFLWTTNPHLQDAFQVIEAWGFEYKSALVWDKEIPGTGYWVRGQHEHLLICTKGKPPLPNVHGVPASVIREKRREHSRKPDASYEVIERMYPTLPKIELFARRARKGWDAWGNEAPKREAAE